MLPINLGVTMDTCYVCHTINTHTKPVKGKRICGRCAMLIRKDKRREREIEAENAASFKEAIMGR